MSEFDNLDADLLEQELFGADAADVDLDEEDLDLLLDVEDEGEDHYGIIGAAIAAGLLAKKGGGSIKEGIKSTRTDYNTKRIAKLVGKMAKLHDQGKTESAKKIGAKLLKVVMKLQRIDPSYKPSKKVQSWLDWAVDEAKSGGSDSGDDGGDYDDYDGDYAPSGDGDYAPSGWEGDVDWVRELEGALAGAGGDSQGGGGYPQSGSYGYPQSGSYGPQGVADYQGPYRNPYEDPNVYVATPGPGWGGGPSNSGGRAQPGGSFFRSTPGRAFPSPFSQPSRISPPPISRPGFTPSGGAGARGIPGRGPGRRRGHVRGRFGAEEDVSFGAGGRGRARRENRQDRREGRRENRQDRREERHDLARKQLSEMASPARRRAEAARRRAAAAAQRAGQAAQDFDPEVDVDINADVSFGSMYGHDLYGYDLSDLDIELDLLDELDE